jgi:AcrR family transcriptional regulator
MKRDKSLTRKKIIEALHQILTKSGGSNIGINSIAKEACVDKVLIYRYFGGLEQLLKAYADETNLWPDTTNSLGELANICRATNISEILGKLLLNQLKELRSRKEAQEIMRWELSESNVITDSLASARVKQIQNILNKLPIHIDQDPKVDIEALLAILNAGITYMVLKSKTSDKYLGIDLHSNFGWKRLENMITNLTNEHLKNVSIV